MTPTTQENSSLNNSEQQRRWLELRQYTTEQLETARLELDETHGGYEV